MYQPSTAMLGMLIVGVTPQMGFAQAVNLGPETNNIIADGLTKTKIVVKGDRTSIHTDTISGNTGFNSFSDFQQAAGTRVDLYVPDQAQNLINVVRNGQVVINGTLNAYKDGKIGGNVFFANSKGFVVGKSGVVNVGRLSVTTPTKTFLDTIIRADGSINNAVANQLMSGVVPLSSDGFISISGKINADGGIALNGRIVNINGRTGPFTAEQMTQREKMESTVNVLGMDEGAALVSRGGVISIVSAGNTTVSGTINTSSKVTKASNGSETAGAAGRISIQAGGDIDVTQSAVVSADALGINATGGEIIIKADGTLRAADGSHYSATGTGAGNGGFIELSGKTAIIGAVQVSLATQTGDSGTFLIDPYNLYIGGAAVPAHSGGSDSYSLSANIVSDGANIILQADNSITVAAGGILDSRKISGGVSTGNSGSITVEAPTIVVGAGSQLLAAATTGSGFADGNILLEAIRTGGGTAEILLGDGTGTAPEITGGDITLAATATHDTTGIIVALPTANANITINSANITASGALNATATAESSGGLIALPVGVVVTNVDAVVDVKGTSVISAGSMNLTSSATAISRVLTESLAPADASADGAVAVSTVNSTAISRIGGSVDLTIANALELEASNTIVSIANATPSAAAFGASVGVSVVHGITTAEIADDAEVSAGSLTLSAASTTEIGITAAAAAGGAEEPQDGSEADKYLSDPAYAGAAETTAGGVSVVGALAISDLVSETSATLSSSKAADIDASVSVTATNENDVDITADGSAVDSATGVGVAVAINLAKIGTNALITQDIQAAGISISAGMTGDGNRFSSIATSGAGASDVGVAGSLAVNLIDTQSMASVATGTTLTLTGDGAVSLDADNQTDSTAEARPVGGGGTGDTVGVGASIALNILANRSKAEVADGATIAGVGDLTLSATAIHSATTDAEAGSAGGISLTPALGLSMINNTTLARLGTGPVQTSSGNVSVSAMQTSTTITNASGEAAGSKAAIGAALALALVDDTALATTERSVNATGTVTFAAAGASSSTLSATASASGAAAADEDGTAQDDAAQPDVDTAVTEQLAAGSEKQEAADVGDDEQQASTVAAVDDGEARSTADSSGSKVSVAAAVGVNVQNSIVTAAVPDDIVITSGGTLTLSASNNTEGQVTASGAAVGVEDEAGDTPEPSAVGIGAGVAINLAKAQNNATLGVASHSVGGLVIAANKLDVALLMADPSSMDTKGDTYLASATSGAGAGKVGIAGSVALNLIDTQSVAKVAAGSTVAITGGGSVSLEADNQTDATAEAKPVGGGTTGETVGIGASVALNILANRSTAEVADGATITGVADLALAATAIHSATTDAEAGSAGGVSITPALGLSMISNTTMARLGTGSTQTSTGNVSVSAMQTSTTITNASGAAAGSKAAIGAALALALVDDTALATTARSVNASGTVTFAAAGASSSTLSAIASASGAAEADEDGTAQDDAAKPDVDTAVTDELSTGSDKQKAAGVGSDDQQASTDSTVDDDEGRSASTSEGKISVAAAIAVNVQNNSVTAAVPDGVKITSGGALTLSASANTDASMTTNAGAVGVPDESGETPDPSKVGIGAAVGVNVVKVRNSATLGVAGGAGHNLGGLVIAANKLDVALLMADPSSTDTKSDIYLASAESGAGGSKVGIAGSVSLNLIDGETNAKVMGDVTLTGAGIVSIHADEEMLATATAAPLDEGATGGKVGVGASFALNKIDTDVTAEVVDGAALTNGASLDVSATSDISTVTEASAGAAGGIAVDVSLALALLNENTTARVGTGAALSMAGGDVIVSATNTGSNEATSEGENKSGKVGVGASAALILGGGDSDGALSNTSKTAAVLMRDVTAGSLTVSASANRTYDANATATAGGGNFSETDETKNDTTGGKVESSSALDKTKDSQGETSKGTDDGNSTGKDTSKISVAAAAGVAAVQDNVSANLAGVSVNVANAIVVSAYNQTGVMTSGKGSASNPEAQTGVGIGVALGIINNKSTATIGDNAHIVHSGALTVSANNRENADGDYLDGLTARAEAGASSKKLSIAGALAIGISTGDTKAKIGDGVAIDDSGVISVTSDVTSQLSAKAVAKSLSSGKTAVGASIALVVSDKDNKASIGSGNVIVSDGVSVAATNHKVDAGTPFEFGAPDEIIDDIKTALSDDALLGANNYYVEAIGGAAANNTAVQGSFGIMVFNDEITATIGESQDGGSTDVTSINARTGNVNAEANSDFLAKALTGALSLSGKTGIGVSANVIVSTGVTRGKIANNAIITNAGNMTVSALAKQDIQAFSITAAGGGSTGIAGVATVIVTENTSEAIIGDDAQITGTGAVNVLASNELDLSVLGGGAAASGKTGVGGSVVVGVIEQTTTAKIGNGASVTAGDVVVSADSAEDISTLVVGLGVGGSTGVGGAVAVYSISDTTTALIDANATVLAANNVGVLADDAVDMDVLSGSVGLSGSTAVGASVSVAVIDNTTKATIADGASVTGRANGAALTYVKDYTPTLTAYGAGVNDQTIKAADTGEKNQAETSGADRDVLTSDDARYMGLRMLVMERGATEVEATGRGVIVNATGNTSQRSLVVGAAASGSNAVTLSANVPVITSSVEAAIGEGARINLDNNGGAAGSQTVVVSAAQDLYHIGIAGSVAVGGSAGIGAGIDVAIIDLTTKATVGDDAELFAKGDIAVTAFAHEDFVGAGASVGVGGTVGGAGGIAVFSLNSETEASIGASAKAHGGANLIVAASDITRTSTVVGGIGVGGTAGIGASIGVGLLNKTVTASIGDGAQISAQGNGGTFIAPSGDEFSSTTTSRGVLIDAYSNESVSVLGVAGGVGGTAGVAGNVTVEMLDVTTLASVGDNVEINNLDNNTSGNGAQDVTISARDSSSLAVIDAALGFGTYAGIAGAVDVAIIRNTTAASIGDGSDVRAKGDITVAGLQNVQTDSIVVSAAGAAVGIAAGVSVTSIGDGLDPDGEGSKKLEDDDGNSIGDFVQDGVKDQTVNNELLATSENSNVQAIGTSMQAKRDALDVSGQLTTSAPPLDIPAGTSASIGSANIDAGGKLAVESHQTVETKFVAGAIAAGGVGLGAGVGVTVIDTTNTAQIIGDNADLVKAGNVLVRAGTSHVMDGKGLVAAVGGIAGAAALNVFTDTSNTYATISGVDGQVSGLVNVDAESETELTALAGAVGAGGSVAAAAGVAVGVITKTTTAQITGTADIEAGDVIVEADSVEDIGTLVAGAAAGGAAGGAGTVAVMSITTDTTAKIGAAARVVAQGNAAVLSDDRTSVDMLNLAAAVGGTAAVGAAVGVVVIDSDTQALIEGGAQVTALGKNDAQSFVTAYNSTFGAISTASDDEEKIEDRDFKPDDIDPEKVSASTGNRNALLTSEDAKAAGLALLSQQRTAVAATDSARGVIVNATDTNALRSLDIGGAAGGVLGAAFSASVPVVTTDTLAQIGANAQINQEAGVAGADQSVVVAAASDIYSMGISGAVAVGGVGGVGAGLGVAIISNTTRAKVGTGALLAAKNDVLVSAKASEDISSAGVAGAVGGLASLAGGITTVVMTNVTEAELGGTTVAQGNVDVLAEDITRSGMLAGSVAVGGAAGIGAAVSVISLDKTTTAKIANGAQVTAFAIGSDDHTVYTGNSFTDTRSTSGGINVDASSKQSAFTLAIAGAAGLGAGVSGVVSVELMDVKTAATIGNNVGINQEGSNAAGEADQDVVVSARDTTVTMVFDGGFAAGLGAGIAGAIDVGVFKNATSATIGDDTTVHAKGDVLVSGLSNKAGSSTTVSGALGLIGIAAGISVYSYGDGISATGEGNTKLKESSEDGATGLTAVTDKAQENLNDGSVNENLQSSDNASVKSISSSAQAKRNAVELTDSVTALDVPAGTSANIGNATIDIDGKVAVTSSDKLVTEFETGAIAGGAVGVGAGIGILDVDTDSTAQISGASSITANQLAVLAKTNHNLVGTGFAGTGGLAAAISADVAMITDNSSTLAQVEGEDLFVSGTVSVEADADREVSTTAESASLAGLIAVGVSVAESHIGGSVSAKMGNNASIGTDGDRAGAVTIAATSNDRATSDATASGGGVGAALQGTVSEATVSTAVLAEVDRAQIYSDDHVLVHGGATSMANATATGLAIAGGLAVAGSEADAIISTTVNSTVSGGSVIDAASAQVLAASTTTVARTHATGASGALIGVTATAALSKNTAHSDALVTGSSVRTTGNFNVNAMNATNQDAYATGNAGGFVAAGSNDATVFSETVTTARVADMVTLSAGDVDHNASNIIVSANGIDLNKADVEAGSGGVIAGSAAEGTTITSSLTEAALGTGTGFTVIATGAVTVDAEHTSNFVGIVDSRQASLAGASGAQLTNRVVSNVNASLGDNMTLTAQDLAIRATNRVLNYFRDGVTNADDAGWNVDSVSGGLGSFPSGGSSNVIVQNTMASVGTSVAVTLAPKASPLSLFSLEAHNQTISRQKVKLDSGGAIASASAEIEETIIANATVDIGDDAEIVVEKGDIKIAAWGEADVDLRAAATTYGLAGAPSGKVDILYRGGELFGSERGGNLAHVGERVRLEASEGIITFDGSDPTSGTLGIYAGKTLNGEEADLKFNATLDIFNKTAIPIPANPDPSVTVAHDATVVLDDSGTILSPDDNGIRAAGDITVSAHRGDIEATAVGTGKDIYREALAAVASAVSNAFGGGDVSFDYNGGSTNTTAGIASLTNNARVQTGIQRSKKLDVRYLSDSCNPTLETCIADGSTTEIKYSVTPETVGSIIQARVEELEILIAAYDSDPIAKAAYRNEIRFLQEKLVSLGLGSFTGTGGAYEPGIYSGPSPKAIALQAVNDDLAAISTASDSLVNSLTGLVGTGVVGTGSSAYAVSLETAAADLAAGYNNATLGVIQTFNDAVAKIGAISTYAGSSAVANVTAATNAKNAGVAAIGVVTAKKAENVTKQGQITTNQNLILAAEADLAEAKRTNNVGDQGTLVSAIGTYKTNINTLLSAIASNNDLISTNAAAAKTHAATVQSQLSLAVTNTPAGTTSGDNPTGPDVTAKKNAANAAITPMSMIVGTVSTGGLAYNADIVSKALTNSNTKVDASIASLADKVTGLNTLHISLGTNQATAASAASSSEPAPILVLELEKTATRLGNIFLEADQIDGTGAFNAPGDAEIKINNYTSNSIRADDLYIPDYDAGNLRVNGVLVANQGEINNLNRNSDTSYTGTVITSANSSRGLVEINSHYNPESSDFFVGTSSSVVHKKTARVAPDLILNTGAIIENTQGAVNITSDAGNVYINGQINAGSVNILVKNGDFVASYVNGFNHIGGDPASWIDPTDDSEAGKGITANGSISIAARYLNINSTIQSGIAEWTLGLTGSELLTAQPADMGITDADITTALNASLTTVENDAGQDINIVSTPSGIDAEELAEVVAKYNADFAENANTSPVRKLTINGIEQFVNIKDYLSPNNDYRLEFTRATADAYATAKPGKDAIFSVINENNTIGASYDAQNDRYLVDGASTKGGFIQLFGQIMNTSATAGRLNVLDGFGTINITNTSGLDIVLKTLSTGKDDTGDLRGTKGKIDITDVISVQSNDVLDVDGEVTTYNAPTVTVRNTIYEREYVPGSATGQITTATRTGIINNTTGEIAYGGTSTSGSLGDRDTSYQPIVDQRYVWQTAEIFGTTSNYSNTGTSFFGSQSLSINEATSLNFVNGPNLLSKGRLADGTYVSTDYTQSGTSTAVTEAANGVRFNQAQTATANSALPDNPALVSSEFSYVNDDKTDLTQTGSSNNCVWYSLCIAQNWSYTYSLKQEFTKITTDSLKADNPIGVHFIGTNSGGITIASNSNVVLTNNISNIGGLTSITASGAGHSVVNASTSSMLTSRGLYLDAGASVGGVKYGVGITPDAENAAIVINQTGAGTGPGSDSVTAIARDGNVTMYSSTNIVTDQITATGAAADSKGNVSLFALNSISGVDSGALISGNKVNLTALSGSIGSTADGQQLHVNSGFTENPLLRPFGEDPTQQAYLGLTATAGGDIGIKSTGTMLVDKVLSIGGDVRLVSETGYILDNNPVEAVDTRTYIGLLGYWQSLGLMAAGVSESVDDAGIPIDGDNNQKKQEQLVLSHENSTTQSYRQYWEIRETQADGGAAYQADYSFELDTDSQQGKALTKYFTERAIAAESSDVEASVASDIADYNDQKTTEYHKLAAKVGDLTETFDEDYKYVMLAPEREALTKGAVWTERELAFSISPGALKTVTSTNPVLKDPNVAGRTVSIEAHAGIGETIIDADTLQPGISIRSSTNPRDLTLDQKVALAAAERSDLQLILDGAMTSTAPVIKTGETAESFASRVAAYDAAIVEGLQTYGGTPITIALGVDPDTLDAHERIAFDAAAAGLYSADVTVLRVLSKRPLNFNASQALNVTVPESTASGLDAGTAYLASKGGAALAAISTFAETRIKVRGSITNAAGGAAVSTGNLILEASQGSIGSTTTPLALDLKSGSTTTARAQNLVNISFDSDGNIDTIYSPGDVTLTAADSLINANNDDLINILGSQVDLVAVAGAIGTVDNFLNVGVNLQGGIDATAATGINMFGPSRSQFVVNSAIVSGGGGGTINLGAASQSTINGLVETAGTINLSPGGRQVITSTGDIHSGGGTINIAAGSLKMLNGATLRADGDKVDIDTVGDAQVTGIVSGSGAADAVSINAGGSVQAATNDPRTDITAIASGAGVKIVAAFGIGDKTIDNVTADGDLANGGNAVTDVANPLRIKTNELDMEAQDGDIEIAALTSITASQFTSPNGAITVTGTGSLSISNATSGGSQSFISEGDLDFTKLTTTGITGDVGDVTAKSNAGSLTGGDIDANGSIFLSGLGVNINVATAGVDSTIISTGIGNDVEFVTVEAGNDSTITSDDDIIGDTQIAGNTVKDTAGNSGEPGGDIDIKTIRARYMELAASGKMTLPDLEVAEVLNLQAGEIIAGITQVPSGPDPLELTLTGFRGDVGIKADVTVDAPAGLVLPELRFVDTTLQTTAQQVNIQSAFVPGSLLLTTPVQTIFDNNRTPAPTGGSNVQLFEPTFAFSLAVDGNATSTSTYVVKYDATAAVTDVLGGLGFKGISLVRDTVRHLPDADDPIPAAFLTGPLGEQLEEEEQNLPDLGNVVLVIDGVEYKIVTTTSGPAVELRP